MQSAAVNNPGKRAPSLVGKAAVFLLAFAALQLAWDAVRGGTLERLVIHNGTVQPASALVNLLTPDVHAEAKGFAIYASGGGLNIQNGCEGMEALFLLLAAFAVAPIPRRSRWIGLLLGIPVVFVINQARILVLFYAYRIDHSWFDPLHSMVTPIVVVLLIASYFYVWLAHGFVDSKHRLP